MNEPTTAPDTASGSMQLSPNTTDSNGDAATLALTPAENAAVAIAAKHAGLLYAGFDLGAATGPMVDAGYGGFFRIFERGRIYWHHSTGAHEVHGGILSR